MNRSIIAVGAAGVLGASLMSGAVAHASTSDTRTSSTHVHFLPTPGSGSILRFRGAADERQGSPPLVDHGGPIMKVEKSYAIFWDPGQLQDGTPTQGIDRTY